MVYIIQNNNSFNPINEIVQVSQWNFGHENLL